jgi:hypothetical protein
MGSAAVNSTGARACSQARRARVRAASKSKPGTSASRLATAPSSLTEEIATLTTRGPVSGPKSSTPTRPRPAMAWVSPGPSPGVLKPL